MIEVKRSMLALAFIVFVSGCTGIAGGVVHDMDGGASNGTPEATAAYCTALGEELTNEERTCQCGPIGSIESLGDNGDVEGVCRCSCEQGGEEFTIDIGRSGPVNGSNTTPQ